MTLVSLFHRFTGPAPPQAPPPKPADEYAIEHRYWSAPLDAWLRSRRFSRRFDPAAELRTGELRVLLSDGGAHAAACLPSGKWLWSAWMTLEVQNADETKKQEGPRLDAVQNFLAAYRYWAPGYGGHVLPKMRLEGDSPGGEMDARQLLEWALPEEVAHLAQWFDDAVFDQRLAVWAVVRLAGSLPDGERLRSLVDIDPSTGMESPAPWAAEWLVGRVYRRWQLSGLIYGFTHHSGIVLDAGPTPRNWLAGLCRPRWPADAAPSEGSYFDLALLVFAEAALRAAGDTREPVEGTKREQYAQAVEGHLRQGLATPHDQGRDLLRCWRIVCARDLGLEAEPLTGGA